MKKKKALRIIRIDPYKRVVAEMPFMAAGKGTTYREVARIVRAKTVEPRKLMEVEFTPLIVAAGAREDEEKPMWRLQGCEDTAGIGILFGQGPGDGMIDAPVSREWVLKRIVWSDGETAEGRDQRAAETLPLISDEIRAALAAAVDAGPFSDGDTTMWLHADDKALYEPAQALGLTDDASGGQRLTRMGARVREMLEDAADVA